MPGRKPTLRRCAGPSTKPRHGRKRPAATSARQAYASDRRPPPRRVRLRGRTICERPQRLPAGRRLELDKLVGIVGGCQRHGALRQAHVGGAFKEPARGIHVAAFDQFQTLAVEMERLFALGSIGAGMGGRAGAGAAAGGGGDSWLGAITNVVFASANTLPSRLTRSTTISEAPCAPIGTIAARTGSTESGTAQTPGAMACPSVS
jgi:hypothetical protein